ncbi:hypothetical protein, partial [Halomonas halmophila]|uniref:hypothetical protein n=1 Tax=Halomonas halmophila TaxID=252 RepID=UPI0014768AC1
PDLIYTPSDGQDAGEPRTVSFGPIEPLVDISTSRPPDQPGGDPLEEWPFDRDPGIYADPIVANVASAQNDLSSTASLMSDINTGQGVRHPLMTAVDAIQSLGGTSDLQSQALYGNDASVEARGAVLAAVDNVGFEPLSGGQIFAASDFDERLKALFDAGWQQQGDELITERGESLRFVAFRSENGWVVQASAMTPSGNLLGIDAIHVQGNADVSAEFDANGIALLTLDEAYGNSQLEIGMANGYSTLISLDLSVDGQGDASGVSASEVIGHTFTAQTERLVFARNAEASRLMNAVSRGML